jgi:hypothetical protein
MTPRELQCLLITGWAHNNTSDGHWTLLDPDGTAAHWIDATPGEVTELENALAQWPTIQNIWQGMVDFVEAHRADCQSRVRNPCNCDKGKPPAPEQLPSGMTAGVLSAPAEYPMDRA